MIKIGDIVRTKAKEGSKILPAVVTNVHITSSFGGAEKIIGSIDVLFADGTYGNRSAKKLTETGRHIDMQSVLDSIK